MNKLSVSKTEMYNFIHKNRKYYISSFKKMQETLKENSNLFIDINVFENHAKLKKEIWIIDFFLTNWKRIIQLD